MVIFKSKYIFFLILSTNFCLCQVKIWNVNWKFFQTREIEVEQKSYPLNTIFYFAFPYYMHFITLYIFVQIFHKCIKICSLIYICNEIVLHKLFTVFFITLNVNANAHLKTFIFILLKQMVYIYIYISSVRWILNY